MTTRAAEPLKSIRPRPGRPPKISEDAIVKAALTIGLERVSLRDVAALLGVTAPGLYYHIRTRADLLRLVLTTMAGQLFGEAPERSVSFRHALSQFAHGLFWLLRDHPQLLPQITDGHIPQEHVAAHLARLLAQADTEHLGQADALKIVEGVVAATIGAAVMAVSKSNQRPGALTIGTVARAAVIEPATTAEDAFRIVETVIELSFGRSDSLTDANTLMRPRKPGRKGVNE
jgi:AcrR family transcriptional regulator